MYMSVLLETRRRRLLLTLRLVMIYYEEALSTVPLCLGSSMSASLLVLCIACTLRARSGENEETLWSWNHSAFPYTVAPCERTHRAEKVPEDGTCRKQPASGHMLRDSSWFSP